MESLRSANLQGKNIVMRVDFNVPIDDDSHQVTDVTRIAAVVPTLRLLLDQGVSRIMMFSHLGRPKGIDSSLSLEIVVPILKNLIGEDVQFLDGVEPVENTNARLVVRQNTRFYEGEKNCDINFASKIADNGDVYVSDAFAVAHRAESSVTVVPDVMKKRNQPVYPGLLLEQEISMLSSVTGQNVQHPFVMIVSGAKIDTKIGMIKNFYDKVDTFIVGGGIANTFLKAQGYEIGSSLCEDDKLDTAREILEQCKKFGKRFVVPVDAIISSTISNDSIASNVDVSSVPHDMKILDVGEKSIQIIKDIVQGAKLVVWNGPLGVYEYAPFARGTRELAGVLANLSSTATLLGGGDTVDAINAFDIPFTSYSHVSTGGGAMIEFLEGKSLPGIIALS